MKEIDKYMLEHDMNIKLQELSDVLKDSPNGSWYGTNVGVINKYTDAKGTHTVSIGFTYNYGSL